MGRAADRRGDRAVSLSVRLSHRFGGLLLEAEFEAIEPGVTVLFGPSGAGKSSIIAAIGGLFRPQTCHIALDGEVLADTESGVWVRPEKRRAGLVFQDSRLFPHMTVAGNLRFGMRRARAISTAFDEVVALLGLGPLLARRPRTLSGGERQRVAIGRALLAQPRLLLMDEPLASLDATRKAEILPYLARLKTALRLPILYVTHALDEVAGLADQLVLIEAGRIVAQGPLAEIAARADLPLATRDDAGALLEARIGRHQPERMLTELQAAGTRLLVPLLDLPEGTSVRVRIPAREVILARKQPEAISVQNIVAGTIRRIAHDPNRHSSQVEIALPAGALLSRVTPDAIARLALAPGQTVLALVKSTAIEVLRG